MKNTLRIQIMLSVMFLALMGTSQAWCQTETTLADLAAGNGVESESYTVTGSNLACVHRLIDQNGAKYLVVRDDAQSATHYVDVSQLGNVKSMLHDEDGKEIDQTQYRQNNWMLVKVSDSDYSKYGCYLSSVTGTLDNAYNLILDATNGTVVEKSTSETPDLSLNTYTPANLCVYDYGEGYYYFEKGLTYDSDTYCIKIDRGDYFLMPPKRCELATVTWLVQDGCRYWPSSYPKYADTYHTTELYLPADTIYNPYRLRGSVLAGWAYNEKGEIEFTINYVYEFKAIVMEVKSWNAVSKFGHGGEDPVLKAPATATPWNDGSYSQHYMIFYVDVEDEADVTTGVSDVQAERDVQSVRYYDLTGRTCAKPFNGVNVVVTTYTDGSHTTAKVLK